MKVSDRRPLPRRPLSLPVFGLGCAQIGSLYQPMNDAEAAALLASAWEVGLRFFDTAPLYGYTRSERRLALALAGHDRDAFVLSTKVGRLMRPDATVRRGDNGWADPLPFRPIFDYTRDGLMRSYEDSLLRLDLERIDILLVHDIGRLTHGDRHEKYWQELTAGGGFRALEELRQSGAVSAIGLGVNEWQIAHASMQELDLDCTVLAGRYTLLEQDSLSPFLDECVRRGHAIVVAGPLNSGILAGGDTYNYVQAPAHVVERVRALEAACRELDVPLPAAALQFPLAHPAVVSCIAGADSAAQVRQNSEWFEAAIPPELWSTLRKRGLIDERAPAPGDR